MELTWQERMRRVVQRDEYVWNNKMWTDCVFQVGNKEFSCHRLYLAKTSPVFAVMLFGDLYQEGKTIVIPDISAKAFTLMLQYIYCGFAQLDDFHDSCALLVAAKKYLFPPAMQDDCRAFIWENISPDNVWSAMHFALQNFEQEIYYTAVELIQRDGYAAFSLPDFVEVPHHTLLTLLRCHGNITLNNKSQKLEACLMWARHQLAIQHKEQNTHNLRETLSEILLYVDFQAKEHQELQNSGLLKESEIHEISKCDSETSISLAENISKEIVRQEAERYDSYFVYGRNYEANKPDRDSEKYRWKIDTYDVYTKIVFPTKIEKIKAFKLLGIQFKTQINDNTENIDYYHEDISIYVSENETRLIGITKFRDYVRYNSHVAIELSKEIVIKSMQNIAIKIIPHISGRYPSPEMTSKSNIMTREIHFKGYASAVLCSIPNYVNCPIILE